MAPDAGDAAAAVAVGMERVETDALIDDDAIFGCRRRLRRQGGREKRSQSQSCALSQELAPTERYAKSTQFSRAVDQLGHPVLVGRTVCGGHLDAQLALLVSYLTRASLIGCHRRHSFLLSNP